MDDILLQIHMIPGKALRFAPSEACAAHQVYRNPVGMPRGIGFEDVRRRFALRGFPALCRCIVPFPDGIVLCRIRRDEPPAFRMAERKAHRIEDDFHGAVGFFLFLELRLQLSQHFRRDGSELRFAHVFDRMLDGEAVRPQGGVTPLSLKALQPKPCKLLELHMLPPPCILSSMPAIYGHIP